ncbi:MAG: hypothetical protein R3C05_17465 [Pirellulaceae bacterium]
MSLSVNDFWNRLASSHLADASQCRHLAVAYAQANGAPPTNVKKLAKWLISSQQLTLFQAQQILSGTKQTLVIDGLALTGPVETPPLSQWFHAADQHNGDTAKPTSMVRLLPDGLVKKTLNNRFRRAVELETPHLQPYRLISAARGERALQTQLTSGGPLIRALQEGAWSPGKVLRLADNLASALRTLHSADLVHGNIHPQNVWITRTGDAILLRDPIAKPVSPFEDPLPCCLDAVDAKLPAGAFAAPEFCIPGKVPDAATDLYALGCLLYLARFGEPPFSATDADHLMRQHSGTIPSELQAVQRGESNDSLLRVIAHLMAKNRDARIPSAEHLQGICAAITSSLKRTVPAAVGIPAPPPPVSAPPPASVPAPPAPTEVPASPPDRQVGSERQPAEHPQPPDTASAPNDAAGAAQKTPPTVAPPSPSSSSQSPSPSSAKPSPASSSSAKPSTPDRAASAASPPAAKIPAAAAPVQSDPSADDSQPEASSPEDDETTEPRKKRPGQRVRKRKKKKKKTAALVLGGVGFSILTLLIAVLLMNNNRPAPEREERVAITSPSPSPSPVQNDTSTTATTVAPAVVSDGKYDIVENGFMPWAPPDQSDPPPLSLLPPGPQMLVVLRPSDILESEEGRKLLALFDADIATGIESIEKRLGVALGEVERLIMAVDASADTGLAAAMSVQLKNPRSLGELRKTWGDPGDSIVGENQTIFAGEAMNADAYYVKQQPPNDSMSVQQFAVGSIPQIQTVAETQGADILLPRQMESTWRHVRADAHVSVVVLPNFLFADGKSMLADYAPSAVQPLKTLLIPDATVAMLTMQFEPSWYGEVRLAPGGSTTAPALSQKLKGEFNGLLEHAEAFLNRSTPHPSWRALALRLPRMLEAVTSQTHTGVSDDQAVANFYLPSDAASNVLLGSWLALNTPAGTVSMGAGATTAQKPWTIEEMIDKPIKVSFDQEPLHFAGTAVVEEINNIRPKGSPELKVVLMGNDLEKKGITQNQPLRDFRAENMKLRDVLTKLVQQANIVKGLTDPSDPEQALIWLVGPNPEAPNEKVILITTRDGAAAAGYTLMPEFVIK